MKVCMVGGKSYPSIIGGIETHIFELSRHLVKKGHEVFIITGKHKGEKSEETKKNIKIYRTPCITHGKLIKPALAIPTLLKALKLDIDIFHCHDAILGFVINFVFKNKTPVVYTAHGLGFLRNDWSKLNKKILKKTEIYNIKTAKHVIAVDASTKRKIKKHRKKVELIPNGVSLSDNHCQNRSAPKNSKFNILYVGRLIPSKGPHLLLKAFKNLPDNIKHKTKLHIVGSGKMEKKIRNVANNVDNVKIYGRVPNVLPFIDMSDIYVLPSSYEGLPLTLLEAMSRGKACISTNVGDLKERFIDKKDIAFTERNVKTITNHIIKLLKNEKLREKLGKNAANKIKKYYTWSYVANKTEKIYEKVIK